MARTPSLVVLDADPTADIRNARRVSLVVRGGEVWTRRELEYGITDGTPADR